RHSKARSLGARAKARLASVARFEALADVRESDAIAAARRSFRVEKVLDDDFERIVAAQRFEPNPAAVDEIGDAVGDGVLDEGLQQKRRHLGAQRFLIDRFLHLEAV